MPSENSSDLSSKDGSSASAPRRQPSANPTTLPSRTSCRHNLPPQLTSLVGREKEIQAVKQRLLSPQVRLLTLTGPGGVGKTRLALVVAEQVASEFEDGVFFVSLAPLRDPSLVLPTIARTLGLKEQGARPAADVLTDFLRGKQLLLLLDNFEPVVMAASVLSELLAGSAGLKVLVTSREALRLSAEQRYPVPPLDHPDPKGLVPLVQLNHCEAVRLFVERAQAVRPDFALTEDNTEAVAEICCQRLEGLPLAIELAASRIVLFSPQAMLGRMEQRLSLLMGGPQDLPERQKTMRNTITWSYDLLEEPEKKLFLRLSVFVGGCTLEAAEAMGNAAGDLGMEVADGVESLVNKSLLLCQEEEGKETRFTMSETIREYGQERLEAGGESSALKQGHARFYLRLASQAAQDPVVSRGAEWYDRLEREHDNFRAVLGWALQAGDLDLGLRLATLLGERLEFWFTRGHQSEGRTWLARLLEASGEEPSLAVAQALSAAGFLAGLQSDVAAGRSFLGKALAIGQRRLAMGTGSEAENKRVVVRALVNLGLLVARQGNLTECHSYLKEGLPLSRELGNSRATAALLRTKGLVAVFEGDHAAAQMLLEESLALSRESEDLGGTATASTFLGLVELDHGEHAAAEQRLERVLTIFRDLHHKEMQAVALAGLALAEYFQGNRLAAWASSDEGLALAREVGDKWVMVWHLAVLATKEIENGEVPHAAWLAGGAEVLKESAGGIGETSIQRRFREGVFASIRASLGEEAFATAVADARAMGPERAVERALAEAIPSAGGPLSAHLPGDEPDSLTPREREVAALVAQGLSNREIGDRLVLSARTIETHVSRILAKLDLKSRSQIAAWAATHPRVAASEGGVPEDKAG